MRFAKPAFFVLVAALAVPLGCDWPPGSRMTFSQTVRTWLYLESGDCLTVGTYRFGVGTDFAPFDARASVKMKTNDKEDMEFLPPFLHLNYRFDDDIIYQQSFELNKGKGNFSGYYDDFRHFESGDEIEYEICPLGGGYIPTLTEIGVKFDYRFPKLEIK